MWKECVETVVDGESKLIQFNEDYRDPDGECTTDFNGTLSGELKWVEFGHKDSSYKEDGELKEAKKVQKTASDFKGKQVGQDGTIYFVPKKMETDEDLDLKKKYVVNFTISNTSGEKIGETMTSTNLDTTDPKKFEWQDTKTIAIKNKDEDVIVDVVVQTENVGITPGAVIASAKLNMADIELFTKQNAGGKLQQQQNLTLDGVGKLKL